MASRISPASNRNSAGYSIPPHVTRVFGDVRFRIDGALLALCFAPDGSAWTVEDPGVLRHWTAETGQQLGRSDLSDLEVIWSFSPDGRFLASGSDSLVLWDVARGELLITVPQPSWITAQAFRGDDRFLATGHDDGVVRLWDLTTGQLKDELAGHEESISALAFSWDGRKLAASAEDRTVSIWDIDSGQLLGRLEGHTDRIQALAWHPQGHDIVSAGWDTTARVWDAKTFQPIILLNGHGDVVSALAYSPDGKLLASADSNHVVWLWDPAAGKPVRQLHGHTGDIACLAFRADGKRLLSGGEDQRLILWEIPSGRNLSHTGDERYETARISLSRDGTRLACVNGAAPVRVWDARTSEILLSIAHSDSAHAVQYSPDGRWIVTGDSIGIVRIWHAADGRPYRMLEGHHGPVSALAFSPDGQTFASAGSTDGYVYVWSMANFEPVLLIPESTDNGTVEGVAFCPGTNLLAAGGVDFLSTGGSDGAICLWDVVNHAPAATFPGGTTRLAIRPDGLQLAATTLSDSFCLWDIPSQCMLKEISGHDGAVTCLAYHPSGEYLATGSDDQTVRLWRVDSGELVGTIQLDTQTRDVQFSPDGKSLYTANANTTCYRLDVTELLGS